MVQIKLLFLVVILSSCSSTFHLNKAIKKDPSILNNRVVTDTLRVSRIDSIPYIFNDTIRYKLIETFRDTIVKYKYKYIKAPVTRQEKRLEYKLDKLVENNNAKLDKLIARLDKRKVNTKIRQENKGSKWWVFGLIGLFIGFLTRFIKIF